ncbi:MAG TPA: hypothetical protein VJN21_14730 [Candidatus Acidoferrales bacterium]|nr:hypothetical protein [Candidatus Acidoferrales bacterium]
MKCALPIFTAMLAIVLSAPLPAQMRKTPSESRGEQFYVISSVDMQKHQIVFMRPTQLTVVATTNDQTTYVGEQSQQKLALKDLRAGQTVWATIRKDKSGDLTVARVREGAMTVAELHRLYLDYPAK